VGDCLPPPGPRPAMVVPSATTLSVPHKMISESPARLSINGVRESFARPLVKSTYVKLTGNAQSVLLKNSTRLRPQGRNGDFSLMCFLWTAYLGSGRRNSPTSDNPTYEK
jgi:hypothetical protein